MHSVNEMPEEKTRRVEPPEPAWQGSSRDGFLQACLQSRAFSQKLDKEVNTEGYK